jgi:probable F420-dependent oxidoreductase
VTDRATDGTPHRTLKVDAVTLGGLLADLPAEVRDLEQRGYDGWFVGETAHDPLLACVAAGSAAERMEIGTAITVAFPRSPMHVAYAAHDLQALTGGRFVLGLGSQIKPHIEKRFGTPWSRPAARMREYILALHAIWHAWQTGEPLRFRGEFTRHTLMTPFFTPDDHGFGPPPVYLAAVGPKMTEVVGEVADGLLAHGFTTPRYLREVTLPAVTVGAQREGRDPADIAVSVPLFVVTGDDDAGRERTAAQARGQIAFYGSTPAYRAVLDLHGWGDLHEELHALSVKGDWDTMPTLIDDEVLDTFAVVAPPGELGARIRERYLDVADRVALPPDLPIAETTWPSLLAEIRDGA